jgi:subfamily B ATP-binding cassette protein MsbA
VGRSVNSEVALVWRSLRRTWPLMADKKSIIGLMVVVGLAASVAESIGFSLVILLVYMLVSGGAGEFGHAASVGFIGATSRVLTASPLRTGATIVALIFAKGALTTGYNLLAGWIGGLATHRARLAVYGQYLEVSYGEITREGQGELAHRLSYETSVIASAINHCASILINVGAVLVYGLYIAHISSTLAAAIVVLGMVIFGAVALWARRIAEDGAQLNAINERLFDRMLAGIAALRLIRSSGTEAQFKSSFAAASAAITQTSQKHTLAEHASRPIRDVALLSVLAAFLWVAHSTGVALTAVITVVALLYRLLPHVTGIEDLLRELVGESAALRSAIDAIERSDKRYPPVGTVDFNGLTDGIELRSLGFRYPDNDYDSLEDLSVFIRRGSIVAVTGASGCGKTTLVNLLARLYEPTSGAILIDGRPLETIRRDRWFASVSFAGQDFEPTEGTIAENVRLGRTGISDAEINWALRLVEAEEFVATLPGGINTEVGYRGTSLSGGQRQRIGLARALVTRPDLLVLDEATSAIDLRMEARVLSAISSALPGSTLIVITHRESLKIADATLTLAWGALESWCERPAPANAAVGSAVVSA